MQNFTKLGAALWVLLASLPALAYETLKAVLDWTPPGLIPGEAGLVSIVYTWPGNGLGATSATAPTAAQASQVPVQTAQVFFADADTEAIIVHNSGLGPSFPKNLYPIIVVTKQLGGTDGSFAGFTNFTFGKANTNQVYMTKPAGALGGTYDVALFFGSGPWMK